MEQPNSPGHLEPNQNLSHPTLILDREVGDDAAAAAADFLAEDFKRASSSSRNSAALSGDNFYITQDGKNTSLMCYMQQNWASEKRNVYLPPPYILAIPNS